MSHKIEGIDQALHLNVPKGSTVFVFPGRKKEGHVISLLPDKAPQIFDPQAIMEAVQDFLDHGPGDDSERGGPWKKIEKQTISARESGIDYQDLMNDIDLNLAEMRKHVPGATIGSTSKSLITAVNVIKGIVEEAWTDPQE